MITGYIALLGCQLLGEFSVRALGIPIPGPVVGMVVLLVVLLIRKPERTAGVVRAADGLLRHRQLLFIPAGAGVVAYLSVLGASWSARTGNGRTGAAALPAGEEHPAGRLDGPRLPDHRVGDSRGGRGRRHEVARRQ